MSAKVLVFVLDEDHIRMQLEPQGAGAGVVTADLTAKEAEWLSRELGSRISVPGECPGCDCTCHAHTAGES